MKVHQIWIYPVKGLRGRSIAEATVAASGLTGDRRWMIIDERGRFVTQRTLPALATIRTESYDTGLRLIAADGSSHTLPVPELTAARVEATIWKDRTSAHAASPEANAWISAILGGTYRLVHLPTAGSGRPTDRTSFADEYPLLLVNKGSVDDLNARLPQPVSFTRFRPNLVVEGAAAWAEDNWQRLQIGDVRFEAAKACSRCVVVTIDQESGIKMEGNEPLRTLSRFRRDEDGEIIFGRYLVPDNRGRIKVGDVVTPIA